MTCDRCYQPLHHGYHGLGICPLEPRRAAVVRSDSIPGGIVISHGLCHADGSPRRFDSYSEMNVECQKRDLVKWTDVYTEDRTKDARVKADWQQSGEAQRAKRDRDEARRMKGREY